MWPGGGIVRALDLPLRDHSRLRLPVASLSRNDQVVHTRAAITKHGIGHRALRPYGWEGNRRSGIAVAMDGVTNLSELSTYAF